MESLAKEKQYRRKRAKRAADRSLAPHHLKSKKGSYYLSPERDKTLSNIWHFTCLSAIAAAIIYGASLGGHFDRLGQTAFRTIDQAFTRAGFKIDEIQISGLHRLTDAQITATLPTTESSSIWGFDPAAARTRLKELPWVQEAQVSRLLPGTIKVEIKERTAFAYWQYKGAHYIIDNKGAVIKAAKPGSVGHLPNIVGEGAPAHAGKLLSTLMRHPQIATRVKALIRIGDRRWNIALKSGAQLMLPEHGIGKALRKLTTLHENDQLLAKPLQSIDMRMNDRITVRPNNPKSPLTIPQILESASASRLTRGGA